MLLYRWEQCVLKAALHVSSQSMFTNTEIRVSRHRSRSLHVMLDNVFV